MHDTQGVGMLFSISTNSEWDVWLCSPSGARISPREVVVKRKKVHCWLHSDER
jgi:hypothetical protein